MALTARNLVSMQDNRFAVEADLETAFGPFSPHRKVEERRKRNGGFRAS